VHWWNPEISALRATANRLRRIFQRKRKRHGTIGSTKEETEAKAAKRALVRAIKRAKEAAWKSLCDLVQKNPWGLPYKVVMDKLTRPPPIPELDTKKDWPEDINNENSWKIDIDELKNAARGLKPKIAPGPDGLTNEVVRAIVSCNPDILIGVYNTCLANGVFPKTWKIARFVLIRKSDKPLESPSSYRFICLLDCLGKLFKKVLDNRLRRFLDENDRLHSRQFVFRKGRSTIDALNVLRETVTPNRKIGILTLDIKNAFNSASWNVILDAMQEKEVPKYLQRIVSSYLENRTLNFDTGGAETKVEVTCGVPQESVIGPTLWNIMYDGLLKTQLPHGVEYLAFADDVALIARARDSIQLLNLLSSSAQRVHGWLTRIGLSLAVQKCEAMIIT
jgi:hypothetical protein